MWDESCVSETSVYDEIFYTCLEHILLTLITHFFNTLPEHIAIIMFLNAYKQLFFTRSDVKRLGTDASGASESVPMALSYNTDPLHECGKKLCDLAH